MDSRLKLFVLTSALILALSILKRYIEPPYFVLVVISLFVYFSFLVVAYFNEVFNVKSFGSLLMFIFLSSLAAIIIYFFLHLNIDLLGALLRR